MYRITSPVCLQSSKRQRAFALLLVLTFSLTMLLAAFFDSDPILFQSRESKTADGGPVFNRVSYRPGWDRDLWVMQQGHAGLHGDFGSWDRIALVVKHDAKKSAEFFQLVPGDLIFEQDAQIPKRAACFTCHTNGPRAIRPDFTAFEVGSWDRLRLFLWNLRVKTYGPVSAEKQRHDPDFRWQVDVANLVLEVKACVRCHDDARFFGRGHLTKQNFPVIDFMLREGLMPPPGFALSDSEKTEVLRFIGKLN